MDIFAILFYQPVYNILVGLYYLLGQNLGLAIIALGLLFRILTIPMTRRQIKLTQHNQEYQDKLTELKDLYRNNQKKLQEEQLKLQQEYLPGQLGGCLPLILQLILFSQIYIVIGNIFREGVESFNRVAYPFMPTFAAGQDFNTWLLGIDLKLSASLVGYTDVAKVLPFIALALLVSITQFYSSKVLLGASKKRQQSLQAQKPQKEGQVPDDFGEIMQRTSQQMMYMLPIMLGIFALQFPAGLALYWTTQNAFVIIQQIITARLEKPANE